LDYAHLRGVVHQDIKPANFLLGHLGGTEQERVVLADFGAAVTFTETLDHEPGSALVASFAYSAPEVITGGAAIDRRADVYSLACTLFRLLTGALPFPGQSSAAAIAHAHVQQAPPKPSELLPWASNELDAVFATALAKRREDRYATAGEFAGAAAQALRASRRPPKGRVVAPPPPPRVSVTPVESHSPSHRRSRRWMIAAAASAAALGLAALGWAVIPSSHDDDRTAHASTPPTSSAVSSPLTGLLPVGYAPGTCTPTPPAVPTAQAVMTCGPNQDPGGPVAGTYTVARDTQALQASLAHVTETASTVVCPGNIQSPGPWRRLADPATPKGTLFCGIRDGRPLLAWTLDSERLLAVVEAASVDSPGLNDLYAWWTSHS
jgi:serine/threonine-protein kinase